MFPIQMTFTVSTPAELAKLVAATTRDVSALGAVDPAANKQGATKPAPKPETAAASAAQPAATEKATQSTTAAASGDSTVTIDKAKDLTMKIVAAKGRDEAVKLLQKYGVPVAAKLPADQVAGFCTDAEAVLAS